MKRRYWIVVLSLVVTMPMMVQAGSDRESVMAAKRKNIEANVPDKSNFDAFLRRDLVKYFNETTGKKLRVDYELLRDKPVQVGAKYPSAYPKFYLWIKLYDNDTLMNTGAARVAAIEKKRFEVTTFADKKEIEQHGYDALLQFPIMTSTKIIEEKIKNKSEHLP